MKAPTDPSLPPFLPGEMKAPTDPSLPPFLPGEMRAPSYSCFPLSLPSLHPGEMLPPTPASLSPFLPPRSTERACSRADALIALGTDAAARTPGLAGKSCSGWKPSPLV